MRTTFESRYHVRSYETGVANRLSVPSLCNYLQEAAGEHADKLGFGILELQKAGLSWMLSRLHVKVARSAAWGADLKVVTWPCNVRRHVVAPRDFQVFDEATGEMLAEGVSEWLMVNLAAQRIVRPTDAFQALLSEEVERTPLAATEGDGKFASQGRVDAAARVLVRRADHDFNDHVNNVHYVEWAFEALPEAFRSRQVAELDVVFRQAAHAGDELESRLEVVDDSRVRCAIVRPADGALLATASLSFGR